MNSIQQITSPGVHDSDPVNGDENFPCALPLVKKFRTKSGQYAYDGNTGAILKVDRITYGLLDSFGVRYKNEVLAELATEFTANQIARTFSSLEALTKKTGVFRTVSVKSRLVSPEFVSQNWQRMAGTFDHLTLEVTGDCNMRCRYCIFSGGYQNIRLHNRFSMPWEIARTAIDFFLKNPAHQLPCQHISFYGGEPTINIQLIMRCVEYARSVGQPITFGMTTNGTLLNERVRSFLVAHDFRLLVSLDGPREVHDENRVFPGGGGTFETIIGNLRALMDSAPEYYEKRVRLQCTLSPHTGYGELLQFFANASDIIRPSAVVFGSVAPGHQTYFTVHAPAEAEDRIETLEKVFLEKVAKEQLGDAQSALLRVLFDQSYMFVHRRPVNLAGWGEKFHTMSGCFPGNFRLFVQTDGTFRVCEKSNNALEIGNVNNGLNGRKICEIYRSYFNLYNNECRKCWAVRFCINCYITGCRRTGEFETRLVPEDCEVVRQFWVNKFRNYVTVLEQNPNAFDYLNEVEVFRARIPVLDFEPSDVNNHRQIDGGEELRDGTIKSI